MPLVSTKYQKIDSPVLPVPGEKTLLLFCTSYKDGKYVTVDSHIIYRTSSKLFCKNVQTRKY